MTLILFFVYLEESVFQKHLLLPTHLPCYLASLAT